MRAALKPLPFMLISYFTLVQLNDDEEVKVCVKKTNALILFFIFIYLFLFFLS